MYVVVQRVLSAATKETGINAFFYLHLDRPGEVAPGKIPEGDPGQLVQKSIAVAPNDNRVHSNLDVVAPDAIDLRELRRHLLDFAERHQFDPFPWEGVQGPCRFRVHMVPRLALAGWAREVKALASAGGDLVERARYRTAGPPSTK
jgi:hypothetical protein